MSDRFFRALAKQASARYPARDRIARHFAYGKLTGDPVFQHLLANGLLPAGARMLDLGCGQAVMAALLEAARQRHASGDWPAGWPPPPNPRRMRGIDLMEKDVQRARAANPGGEWVRGDLRTTEFGPADAVLILDVLHYIDYDAQREALARVRESLGGRGVLLLRVADQADSLRFRITHAVDLAVMRVRGHRISRLYCRPVVKWKDELASLGFDVEEVPMSAGTPFANVLLVSRLTPHA